MKRNYETFEYLITNEERKPVTLALFPGFFNNAADIGVDHILGSGVKNIKCTSLPNKVETLIAFVKHHRVCFAALTLRVSHESQLKNRLIFVEHNPFEVPCEKSLTPAHYLDAKATNRYLVQIPVEHFVLSNTTVVKYTIEPKTTVEFIWFLKWVDQGEGKDDVEIVK